jgi:hypothetical protein
MEIDINKVSVSLTNYSILDKILKNFFVSKSEFFVKMTDG